MNSSVLVTLLRWRLQTMHQRQISWKSYWQRRLYTWIDKHQTLNQTFNLMLLLNNLFSHDELTVYKLIYNLSWLINVHWPDETCTKVATVNAAYLRQSENQRQHFVVHDTRRKVEPFQQTNVQLLLLHEIQITHKSVIKLRQNVL